ncbi:sulfotransferase [Thalassotalea fonticola]|uniref:Sulfotransferase n=1 Tax=Thalassotalea fonticola TaxID=3065649 RepID=A0ABZ0GTS1_9GAMM|nr:sulfotransferase [Colwelliaceae bacterium S1-1]
MQSRPSYNLLTRTLHKIAFNSASLQNLFIDIEKSLFFEEYQQIKITSPIFITSLPRAGTSILLNLLNQISNNVSYTYREMPFLHSPIIWNKFSQAFSTQTQLKERAHGDGLKINFDSPEAFDEVFWLKFYGDHYSQQNIKLWHEAEINNDFNKSYFNQIKKIIYLKALQPQDGFNYISKNNVNVARIPLIQSLFNDAQIIVPFRDPLEQAISLFRQHQKFQHQHKIDKFSYQYMKDIGHFEFGLLHKPIAFNGFEFYQQQYSTSDVDYWLSYWISAYKHILTNNGIKFISFESICSQGQDGVTKLFDKLNMGGQNEEIAKATKLLNSAPSKRYKDYNFSRILIEQAYEIHNKMTNQCILK